MSKRKRVKKFYAVYLGKHKHISLSGIGRIYIGKEFEVSESQYNTLNQDENFKVKMTNKYEN